MATTAVKGVVATAVAAGGRDNLQLQGCVDVAKRCMIERYTPDGTEDSTTVLYIGKALPAGARVISIEVQSAAQGGSATLAIGDLASAARYCAATSVVSAVAFRSTLQMGYVVGTTTNDDQITLTVGGSALTATTGIINVCVEYTMVG